MFASLSGERILVVCAHLDDEVLGAGGTIHAHTRSGGAARALVLSVGVTARGEDDDAVRANLESAIAAQAILGYADTIVDDAPDNQFDTLPLLHLAQRVEAEIRVWRPTCVLTHHAGDLNIDHQITARAVLTATRPMAHEGVRTVLAFETVSATEWHPTGPPFRPTVYLPLSDADLDAKCRALQAYAGELRAAPHPRSLTGLCVLAQHRGMEAGHRLAEAFVLVRTR